MTAASILLVGCGRMGAAMLRGWLADGTASVVAVEPNPAGLTDLIDQPGLTLVQDIAGVPSGLKPDFVVLAVKPQVMDAALPGISPFLSPETTLISIAAGKSIGFFERALGERPVVRAMPNLPASIGRGVTVAVANGRVLPARKAGAETLLSACGSVLWVDDEALIDPVTAVSGSGPAYVFLLVEVLAAAGVKSGLAPDLAMELARQTISGAGELIRQSAETAATLRQNVSSPGGTTLAALSVLTEGDRLQSLFDEAVAAATRRARELGS